MNSNLHSPPLRVAFSGLKDFSNQISSNPVNNYRVCSQHLTSFLRFSITEIHRKPPCQAVLRNSAETVCRGYIKKFRGCQHFFPSFQKKTIFSIFTPAIRFLRKKTGFAQIHTANAHSTHPTKLAPKYIQFSFHIYEACASFSFSPVSLTKISSRLISMASMASKVQPSRARASLISAWGSWSVENPTR